MTPLEISAGVISIANGVFTLSANFWKLKNVDEDLKTCVHLILMVTQDLDTARRLRNRKYPKYRSQSVVVDSPIDRTNHAIEDLELATREISKSIEAVRVEKSVKDSISIANRVKWAYQKKDNFIAQQFVVNAAHNRVLAVIANLDMLPDVQLQLEAPPTYEDVILMSPGQSRALKGKTAAIVVTERYADGMSITDSVETWSNVVRRSGSDSSHGSVHRAFNAPYILQRGLYR